MRFNIFILSPFDGLTSLAHLEFSIPPINQLFLAYFCVIVDLFSCYSQVTYSLHCYFLTWTYSTKNLALFSTAKPCFSSSYFIHWFATTFFLFFSPSAGWVLRNLKDNSLSFDSFQVYLMTKDEGSRGKPVTQEANLMLFCNTWDSQATVFLDGKEMVMPGEDSSMTIQMRRNMVIEKNQHFTLRDGGSTVGTGKVSSHISNHRLQKELPFI